LVLPSPKHACTTKESSRDQKGDGRKSKQKCSWKSLTHNKRIEKGLIQPVAKGIASSFVKPVVLDVNIAMIADLLHS
jgi:hypothetical protein